MNSNLKFRRIGAGIFDFYTFSSVMAIPLLLIVDMLDLNADFYVRMIFLLVIITGTVLLHVFKHKLTFRSLGERYYGISITNKESVFEPYSHDLVIDLIAGFCTVITLSNITDELFGDHLTLSSYGYLILIILLTIYSLYSYKRWKTIKNNILLIGVSLVLYRLFIGSFEIRFHWNILPIVIWVVILVKNIFISLKN